MSSSSSRSSGEAPPPPSAELEAQLSALRGEQVERGSESDISSEEESSRVEISAMELQSVSLRRAGPVPSAARTVVDPMTQLKMKISLRKKQEAAVLAHSVSQEDLIQLREKFERGVFASHDDLTATLEEARRYEAIALSTLTNVPWSADRVVVLTDIATKIRSAKVSIASVIAYRRNQNHNHQKWDTAIPLYENSKFLMQRLSDAVRQANVTFVNSATDRLFVRMETQQEFLENALMGFAKAAQCRYSVLQRRLEGGLDANPHQLGVDYWARCAVERARYVQTHMGGRGEQQEVMLGEWADRVRELEEGGEDEASKSPYSVVPLCSGNCCANGEEGRSGAAVVDPLVLAIRQLDVETVRELAEERGQFISTYPVICEMVRTVALSKNSAIPASTYAKSVSMIDELLSHGAKIDAKLPGTGQTALHVAARAAKRVVHDEKDTEVPPSALCARLVVCLLDRGASCDIKCRNGRLPLENVKLAPRRQAGARKAKDARVALAAHCQVQMTMLCQGNF